MINTSWLALCTLIGLMIAYSVVGVLLSRALPWSDDAKNVRLHTIFGIVCAPYLMGFAVMVVLWFTPNQAHSDTLKMVASFPLIVMFSYVLLNIVRPKNTQQLLRKHVPSPYDVVDKIIMVLLVIHVVFLLSCALLLPLIQNDSLEYATVGGVLYDAPDLRNYPVIKPDENKYGFYATWTHPPLYVSLIYLTYNLNQSSEMPGLMRLISPWVTLIGLLLVYSLGSLVSHRCAGVATLLFVSAPLFFMAAQTALLDPLPITAMGLLLASMVGFKRHEKGSNMGKGYALGLSLWTHSQAILFPMLYLVMWFTNEGLTTLKTHKKSLFFVVVIALLIGVWPFLNSYRQLGVLVTDNPPVLALPLLEWKEHFLISRGLGNVTAAIQYGLLKGWFAIESYGAAYWFMLVGLVVFFKRNSFSSLVKETFLYGAHSTLPSGERLIRMCVITLAAYLSGVGLSLALGMEIFIKNERYMMVANVLVVLIAGYGLSSLPLYKTSVARWIKRILEVGLITGSIIILCAIGSYSLSKSQILEGRLNDSHIEKLSRYPGYTVPYYIKETLPNDAHILSFRPAILYYAQRRMMRHVDTRLLAVYQATNKDSAYKQLQELGITHIHVPKSVPPSFFNSSIEGLLASPNYSTIVFTDNMHQLYKLEKTDVTYTQESIVASAESLKWMREPAILIGGRQKIASIPLSKEELKGSVSQSQFPLNFFQRDWQTSLESQRIDVRPFTHKNHHQEIIVKATIRGYGSVHLMMRQHKPEDTSLPSPISIINQTLAAEAKPYHLERRFTLHPGTEDISLIFLHEGNSFIDIDTVSIDVVSHHKIESN